MGWLDPVFREASLTRSVLVLCASGASARAVRREIARRGGCAGVEVVTIEGKAAKDAERRGSAGSWTEPPALAGRLWARCAGRAALQAAVRGHVDRARLLSVDGPTGDADFDEALASERSLRELDPTREGATDQLLQFAAHVEHRGRAALGDRRLAAVFAVGFGDEAAGLPASASAHALHLRVLAALDAVFLSGGVERPGAVPVPTQLVDDVSGEARWVAQQVAAHRDAGNVLVLVPGAADAERVRQALARSGIAAADDAPRPFAEHGLGALLFRLLPWFASSQAVIEGDDLRRLFQSTLLKHTWALSAEARAARIDELRLLDPQFEGDAEALLRLSRGQVPRVIREAHRVRATAAEWIAAFCHVAGDAEADGWRRRGARLMAWRLEALEAQRAAGSTLRQLRDFVRGFGVKTFGAGRPDTVAMAVLGSLLEEGKRPATAEHLAEAMAGSAGAGELHDGVVLLPYDHYDGRPADLLLATGLHARGFGRAPSPDPILAAGPLRKLGLLSGHEALDARERRLVAAVRRAKQALASAPARSADGRLSAQVLKLLVDEGEGSVRLVASGRDSSITNYGLALDCPEQEDLGALDKLDRCPADTRPPEASPAGRQATQVTLEWIRSGGHVEGYAPPPPVQLDATGKPLERPPRTILDEQAEPLKATPSWARPWLGDLRGLEGASLGLDPARSLAATSAFESLTHCRFQAFAKLQLRLKEADELVEELDAREVGTAAHAALEALGESTDWRVVPGGRDAAVERLYAEVVRAMHDALQAEPVGTPALGEARAGLEQRWVKHWRDLLAGRVEEVDVRAAIAKAIIDGPACASFLASATVDGLGWTVAAASRRKPLVTCLSVAFDRAEARVDPSSIADGLGGLTGPVRSTVLRVLTSEPHRSGFIGLLHDYDAMIADVPPRFAGIIKGFPEWTFGAGHGDMEGTPRTITLDGVTISVNGSIDLLQALGTDTRWEAVVIDYKSWKGKKSAKDVSEAVQEGRKIQVPLYAMVVEQADAAGWGPLPAGRQRGRSTVVYDGIRDAKGGRTALRDGEQGLSLAELGRLVAASVTHAREGQWQPAPHPKSCPVLTDRGADHCDFADTCRMRSMPGGFAPPTSQEDGADGGAK
jgi:RecB family exonuclease